MLKSYVFLKGTLPTAHRVDILDSIRTVGMLMVSMLLFVTPALADTIVLTFDGPTVPAELQCGGTWSEAGLDLTVLPTDPVGCGLELCFFAPRPDHLDLVPAFLDVDLTSISGTLISAVLIVKSVCDCVNAVFYDGTTVVDSDIGGAPGPLFNAPDTLKIITSGMSVDRLAVQSCVEWSVFEIRIEFDQTTTGIEPTVLDRAAPLVSRPNPFNATTRLSFNLEAGGRVQLLIYDVRGRLVRPLVDAEFVAGPWTAAWDGRDASGRQLTRGVYFAKLAVNGRVTATGKVMIGR